MSLSPAPQHLRSATFGPLPAPSPDGLPAAARRTERISVLVVGDEPDHLDTLEIVLDGPSWRVIRTLEAANRRLRAEVAERRRAQASESRLLDSQRRKDEFLATLAHELRNPLSALGHGVQALRHGLAVAAPAKVQALSERMERQVGALSRLVEDLMDISRIEQGRIELRREILDLREVLADAIEAVQPSMDEAGLTLAHPAGGAPLWVHADRLRLGQVFANLLNNALKYTDRGGRVDVTVAAAHDGAKVTIQDTGIGIPPGRLEDIFSMFSQVGASLARSRGGMGIGLALTRKLVQLHGGCVRASSDGHGLGSQFEVCLPRVAGDPGPLTA